MPRARSFWTAQTPTNRVRAAVGYKRDGTSARRTRSRAVRHIAAGERGPGAHLRRQRLVEGAGQDKGVAPGCHTRPDARRCPDPRRPILVREAPRSSDRVTCLSYLPALRQFRWPAERRATAGDTMTVLHESTDAQ